MVGLALLSFGVILARHASLTRIAEELCWVGRVETLNKRFKRWVSNRNFDLGLAFELWIKWVWRSCDFSRPILLVYETKLGDKIGVLMVSLSRPHGAVFVGAGLGLCVDADLREYECRWFYSDL
ncbi:MAG: hypothetical protein MUF87_16665, partial [Anaerolineae bacterium]|nr:hypothetical protein [Anaerolineae bacterium]